MENINKYTILKEQKLVLQINKGVLKFDEFKKVKINIINDADFKKNFSFLIDISNSDVLTTSKGELSLMSNFMSEEFALATKMKTAVILSMTQVKFAKKYLSSSNTDYLKYKIFIDTDQAMNWLNIDIPQQVFVQSELDKLLAQ